MTQKQQKDVYMQYVYNADINKENLYVQNMHG